MNILLEPVTTVNIGALVHESDEVAAEFYGLPTDETEARDYLVRIERNRRNGVGDDYLAYEASESDQIVGGGQLITLRDRLMMGYWVAEPRRGRGYGKAIIRALEARSVLEFPSVGIVEAHIDPRNIGSRALAASMGYRHAATLETVGLMVYEKALQT